jgi:hypothetical protein
VDKNNTIQNAHQEASILNEPGITNTRGRIAMARIDDNDPEHDRRHQLRHQPVVLQLWRTTRRWTAPTADSRRSVKWRTTRAWRSSIRSTGLERVNAGGALNELPVNDLQAVQTRGSLDPAADVVSVRRVAILNKQSA